jgi:hypothetical protein
VSVPSYVNCGLRKVSGTEHLRKSENVCNFVHFTTGKLEHTVFHVQGTFYSEGGAHESSLNVGNHPTNCKADCVWNVTAHAQKPDFIFRRNGQVQLNRRGRQFSRLLSAEVCASAVVMLDTPSSEVVWRVLATHSIRQFPLHFPSRASPCTITFQLDSTTMKLFSVTRVRVLWIPYVTSRSLQNPRWHLIRSTHQTYWKLQNFHTFTELETVTNYWTT